MGLQAEAETTDEVCGQDTSPEVNLELPEEVLSLALRHAAHLHLILRGSFKRRLHSGNEVFGTA